MHEDDLTIADPCGADWDAMAPAPEAGRGARHCRQCQSTVHDLSALTATEAEQLTTGPQPPCVRYTACDDGTLQHRSPPRPSRRRALATLAASVPMLGAWFSMDERTPPRWLQRLKERLGTSEAPPELPPAPVVDPPPPPARLGEPIRRMGRPERRTGATDIDL